MSNLRRPDEDQSHSKEEPWSENQGGEAEPMEGHWSAEDQRQTIAAGTG
jgi:hypothetical protein